MGKSGFHAMSIQALADAADVSVGLIYQYFGNKEDVLKAVIVDILDSYRDEVPIAIQQAEPEPVAQLAAGFGAYCSVVDSHLDATVLAYRESKTLDSAGRQAIKELELGTIEPLHEVITAGLDVGVFADTDPDLSAHNLMLFAHNWALKNWYFAPRYTLEDYIKRQFAVVLRSILPPSSWAQYPDHLSS
jgi:AcrR family transcriptional regulator